MIDCFSRHAWRRLYTNKLPVTAVHVLNNDVLPFFESHSTSITTILRDNGREFSDLPDHHPYERFQQFECIEYRTTKLRRPQSNGFIERLHRTLLDEHFRIKGCTKWHESIEEMQQDLEEYLLQYNQKRPHQGRNMNGQTPYGVFKKGLPKRPKTGNRKADEKAA